MNNTTKLEVMAIASDPDKDYDYDGDYVEYKGKRYFVNLNSEIVEFVGLVGLVKEK